MFEATESVEVGSQGFLTLCNSDAIVSQLSSIEDSKL